MSELQQVLQKLLDGGYVALIGIPPGQQYLFTKKFYAEIAQEPTGTAMVLVEAHGLPVKTFADDWALNFMTFISEAQVPARLEDNRGNPYYCNKYSEAAMKVFKKAMQAGVRYEVLVKSVMLYYKSNVRYKKAIGNYFVQGDWRSDYEALVQAAGNGETSLHNHIKQEVSDGGRSQYKLG
jgi:hypothetical protein